MKQQKTSQTREYLSFGYHGRRATGTNLHDQMITRLLICPGRNHFGFDKVRCAGYMIFPLYFRRLHLNRQNAMTERQKRFVCLCACVSTKFRCFEALFMGVIPSASCMRALFWFLSERAWIDSASTSWKWIYQINNAIAQKWQARMRLSSHLVGRFTFVGQDATNCACESHLWRIRFLFCSRDRLSFN